MRKLSCLINLVKIVYFPLFQTLAPLKTKKEWLFDRLVWFPRQEMPPYFRTIIEAIK
jgi:hypothetical protein